MLDVDVPPPPAAACTPLSVPPRVSQLHWAHISFACSLFFSVPPKRLEGSTKGESETNVSQLLSGLREEDV